MGPKKYSEKSENETKKAEIIANKIEITKTISFLTKEEI
jgi:hypothetical protein